MRTLNALVKLLLILTVVGCANGQVPVIDPTDPNVPPTPIVHDDPPTPKPVPSGAISETGYAGLTEGMAEAQVISAVGTPFRVSETGGFKIYVYAFENSNSVAWVMFKNGLVVRKSRL